MDGGSRDTRGDHRHALREIAVDADDGLIAGLERIDHRGFDASRAGSGNRKGHAILRLKGLAQEHLHFPDHLREPRIHMADQRSRHGAINTRVDRTRPRRHHQSIRG